MEYKLRIDTVKLYFSSGIVYVWFKKNFKKTYICVYTTVQLIQKLISSAFCFKMIPS